LTGWGKIVQDKALERSDRDGHASERKNNKKVRSAKKLKTKFANELHTREGRGVKS